MTANIDIANFYHIVEINDSGEETFTFTKSSWQSLVRMVARQERMSAYREMGGFRNHYLLNSSLSSRRLALISAEKDKYRIHFDNFSSLFCCEEVAEIWWYETYKLKHLEEARDALMTCSVVEVVEEFLEGLVDIKQKVDSYRPTLLEKIFQLVFLKFDFLFAAYTKKRIEKSNVISDLQARVRHLKGLNQV